MFFSQTSCLRYAIIYFPMGLLPLCLPLGLLSAAFSKKAPGAFQKHTELLNFHLWIKSTFFIACVRYLGWNFKGTLWNSTQNILPIHGNKWFLWNSEISGALKFRSSYTFLRGPHPTRSNSHLVACPVLENVTNSPVSCWLTVWRATVTYGCCRRVTAKANAELGMGGGGRVYH